MLGHNYFEVEPEVPTDSQIDTALAFAEKIKTLYPDSKIDEKIHNQFTHYGGYYIYK